MSRRLMAAVGLILVVIMAVGLGRGFAQETEDEGRYTKTKTNSQEGFFRPDLPVGEYACRFFTNYDPAENSFPGGYIQATAFVLDEHEGNYSTFTAVRDPYIKIASVVNRPEATATDTALWEFPWSLTNFWAGSGRITITDTTPKVEISLSRGFRTRALRWTSQCIEFDWPAG